MRGLGGSLIPPRFYKADEILEIGANLYYASAGGILPETDAMSWKIFKASLPGSWHLPFAMRKLLQIRVRRN